MPSDATIVVNNDGTATITYADGSQDTLPSSKTIKRTPTADVININDPEKTAVVNPNQLTPAEKTEVANKIKKANPTLPSDATIVVNNDGTATITYADGSQDTLSPEKTISLDKRRDTDLYTPELKPDADNTPTSAQGKALIDGSDKPRSPLSDTDKTAVTDKVDTSNLPAGTVLTPADKVSGTADAPMVKVEVTYPDGSKDIIDVSVKQKDNAKVTPELKPDGDNTPASAQGKALIDGSDKPGSPLSDTDKTAVTDKVDTSNLPDGTVLTPADKVSGTPENPVVEVTVTYPDGTTDTINVPVKQKDNAKVTPELKPDGENTPAPAAGKALIDGSDKSESPLSDADKAAVKDKVDTSNLPAGTVLAPADKVSGTADAPVVKVGVTYPDGTTDIIDVPVKQVVKSIYQPVDKRNQSKKVIQSMLPTTGTAVIQYMLPITGTMSLLAAWLLIRRRETE